MDANQKNISKMVSVKRIVVNAIRKHQGKTGVSLPELKKILKDRKKLDLIQHGAEIKLALKNAVDRGILQKDGGAYKAKETKSCSSRSKYKGRSKADTRKAVPKPQDNAKSKGRSKADTRKAVPKPEDNAKSKGRSKADTRKAVPKLQDNVKAIPNLEDDAKAIPNIGDDAKAVPNLEDSAKAIPNLGDDAKAVPNLEDGAKAESADRSGRKENDPEDVVPVEE